MEVLHPDCIMIITVQYHEHGSANKRQPEQASVEIQSSLVHLFAMLGPSCLNLYTVTGLDLELEAS